MAKEENQGGDGEGTGGLAGRGFVTLLLLGFGLTILVCLALFLFRLLNMERELWVEKDWRGGASGNRRQTCLLDQCTQLAQGKNWELGEESLGVTCFFICCLFSHMVVVSLECTAFLDH